MKCVESYSFSLMNVMAGFLPGAAQSVAALSVAFSLYGVLFMAFSAVAMAASTRVGNALGAGSARGARLAALAAAVSAPAIWVAVATVLTWPPSQNLLLSFFTTGADPQLLEKMRSLLYLVVVLELFDGAQTILSGIIAGVGKQVRCGARLLACLDCRQTHATSSTCLAPTPLPSPPISPVAAPRQRRQHRRLLGRGGPRRAAGRLLFQAGRAGSVQRNGFGPHDPNGRLPGHHHAPQLGRRGAPCAAAGRRRRRRVNNETAALSSLLCKTALFSAQLLLYCFSYVSCILSSLSRHLIATLNYSARHHKDDDVAAQRFSSEEVKRGRVSGQF